VGDTEAVGAACVPVEIGTSDGVAPGPGVSITGAAVGVAAGIGAPQALKTRLNPTSINQTFLTRTASRASKVCTGSDYTQTAGINGGD